MIRSSSILLLAMFALSGCCDKGTDPPPGTPIDYVAYVRDFDTPLMYRLHLATHAVDSFDVPSSTYPWFTIDAKGENMYFDALSGILALNLTTMDSSLFWPARGALEFSRDGKLAAIADQNFRILTLVDMGAVCSDTDFVFEGRFSRDSKRFYALSAGAGGLPHDVVRIHLDSNCAAQRKSFGAQQLMPVLISADERHWFFISDTVSGERIKVYDVMADSVIFAHFQTPGRGDLKQTSDSRLLFFTNPGSDVSIGDPPGTPYISVYELASNSVVQLVNTTGRFGSDTSEYSPRLGRLAITPDDKYLIAIDENETGRYVIVSVSTLTVSFRGAISPRKLYNPTIQIGDYP